MTRSDRDKGMRVVLAVALLLGCFASWAWSGRVRAAQTQERSDLNLFLDASSAGWAEVADQFFRVPEVAAQTIGALSEHMETDEERLLLLAETIRSSPALDAAFIGYPDGDFIFLGRVHDGDGFRTRSVAVEGDDREVVLTWTDDDLNVERRQVDPDDVYDPRTRPWYITPGTETRMWTHPYVFDSSQQPGISHSAAVLDDSGEQIAVVGIDIRLTQLGEFLDLLAPGPNGEALVIDDSGAVIAASAMDNPERGLNPGQGLLSVENLDDLDGLLEGLEDDRVSLGRSPDGSRTTVARPARAEVEWYLAVQALDADFLGDFSTSQARNIFGIIAVGLATAIVFGFVGWRALRYRSNLKQEAERDELTGVMSRRAVRRYIANQLVDLNSDLSVAIVDLDRFKAVNDSYGHSSGDIVLAELSARMSDFVSDCDAVVGRLGGDEFVIVSRENLNWSDLVRTLSQPVTIGAHQFEVGASVGVAIARPGDSRSREEVLSEADRALFAVKKAGGAGVVVADGAPSGL